MLVQRSLHATAAVKHKWKWSQIRYIKALKLYYWWDILTTWVVSLVLDMCYAWYYYLHVFLLPSVLARARSSVGRGCWHDDHPCASSRIWQSRGSVKHAACLKAPLYTSIKMNYSDPRSLIVTLFVWPSKLLDSVKIRDLAGTKFMNWLLWKLSEIQTCSYQLYLH